RLVVTLRPAAFQVEVEIADTGVGIAPEGIAQIFEPYYSTKETGIGLGLPLTKKIIAEHGGALGAALCVCGRAGADPQPERLLPNHPAHRRGAGGDRGHARPSDPQGEK